jgi:hypothetical protein
MREFTVHECPNCGGTVSTFARSCVHCGAPNRARRGGLMVAGALGVFLVAVGAAAIAALSWLWHTAGDDQPLADDDLTRLSTAMHECEDDASKNLGAIYFIVIPLTADTNDLLQWRAKSLNDIGNGILLSSTSALDGLKEKTLKLSSEQYVFGIRDQAKVIYKWKASRGVARFSTADADSIASFNIQFLAGAGARETEWGAGFARQKGNCYWVNAIIGI